MKTIKTYETPEVRMASMDMEGFICASIREQKYDIEVDESVNTGVEVIELG